MGKCSNGFRPIPRPRALHGRSRPGLLSWKNAHRTATPKHLRSLLNTWAGFPKPGKTSKPCSNSANSMTTSALEEKRKSHILKIAKNKNKAETYEQQQRTKIGGKNCGYYRRQQRDGLGHSQALRGRRCPRSDHWPARERAEGGRSLHQEKRYDGRGRRVALGRSGPALCCCEREARSHRHSLCERRRRDSRAACNGDRVSLRQDLRREREGTVLYSAEGPSPLQRRRLDYPERFGRKRNGCASLYRLRR